MTLYDQSLYRGLDQPPAGGVGAGLFGLGQPAGVLAVLHASTLVPIRDGDKSLSSGCTLRCCSKLLSVGPLVETGWMTERFALRHAIL